MLKLHKLLLMGMVISMVMCGCGTKGNPTVSIQSTVQGSKTQTSIPAIENTPTTTSQLSAGLENLDFNTFIEVSYQQLFSRDPETVVELGLAEKYGVATDLLTDISDEYIRQTQALEADILDQLTSYDRASLSREQQLTYDIYAWYLKDKVEGHAFMYDDYPINPTVFSVPLDLQQWFTDLRPLTNMQEAQDYITCLKQVDTKFIQLVDGLKRREERGVVLPYFLLDYLASGINKIANGPARSTAYFTAFENKIQAVPSLSDNEKQVLLTSAEEAINTSVLPAYRALANYLAHLLTIAKNDAGVWKFRDGEAYYAYLLKHHTSTQLSAEEIHALGLQALDRIHAEMQVIFDQLGYPKDEGIPELFIRVAGDSGIYPSGEIVQAYEDIIASIDQQTSSVFDLQPSIGVIVKGDPIGGYYIAPAIDGSRPGVFYAQNTGYVAKYSMPTLAYHEAIPGHHTQVAIAQQLNIPSFRRGAEFTAYIEGWALYAERLAYDMGVYDHDPYGNLGRLQAEAFRAARLVVDTGLHSKHWTFDQAVKFMVENTGMPESMLTAEVSRYISIPGQATAYYIGYTQIMELRQKAMDELGDRFDLKSFHNLVLGSGAMPLDILEQVVDSYIQSNNSGE